MNTRLASVILAGALIVRADSSVAATVTVKRGGDLQAALDNARAGDTILLEPGAVFTGNFILPARRGSGYVVIRPATPDSALPSGVSRMTPAAAGSLPRLQSPNANPALATAPGAHHWRLLALEFGPNAGANGDIIRLGDGAQRTLAEVPHDIVIDRCYVHGDPSAGQKRGIALNSASTWILNSWIADIKSDSQDSQAIAGWNGPGPFTLVNNYLEAAGENVMFGGADPAIEGLVPGSIVLRGNWVAKPVEWRASRWIIKNLFELKNARNVLVEGNVFEYTWQAAQAGYAVVLTPRNQDGHAPWSTVEEVTFRLNVVRHVSGGVNISGTDNLKPSEQARGIEIRDNVFFDVSGSAWGGSGTWLLIGDGPTDITVEHNTVSQTGNAVQAYGSTPAGPTAVVGFVFRNNIVRHNQYGVIGDGHGVGSDTLAAYFPGSVFEGNVLVGAPPSAYPGGNFFPSVDQAAAQFVDASTNNFALRATSAYRTAATDGLAVGAENPQTNDSLASSCVAGKMVLGIHVGPNQPVRRQPRSVPR